MPLERKVYIVVTERSYTYTYTYNITYNYTYTYITWEKKKPVGNINQQCCDKLSIQLIVVFILKLISILLETW